MRVLLSLWKNKIVRVGNLLMLGCNVEMKELEGQHRCVQKTDPHRSLSAVGLTPPCGSQTQCGGDSLPVSRRGEL